MKSVFSQLVYAPSDQQRGSAIDKHQEMENPPSVLVWLAGWAVIIGLCLLFWLGVYRVVIS